MKQLLAFFLLSLYTLTANSQSYSLTSKIVDQNNTPIEAVTCILLNIEEETTSVLLTDKDGLVRFELLSKGNYKLFLHHLSYRKDSLTFTIEDNIEIPIIRLIGTAIELAETIISVERPLVRADAGRLIYDVPQLIKNQIANNALDALKAIPNIIDGGGSIRLIGAETFSIRINGKPSSMSQSQLLSLLKATPADKVKSIEIMYSAPPRYGVKGALVNIVLDKKATDTPEVQGEASIGYTQAKYASFHSLANVLINRPSLNIDLTLGSERWKAWNRNQMQAIHQLSDDSYDILQESRLSPKGSDWNTRLSIDFTFNNQDQLSAAYIGEYGTLQSEQLSDLIYEVNKKPWKAIHSINQNKGDERLHNVRLDFESHLKLQTGIEYTFYKDPGRRTYNDLENNLPPVSYRTKNKQQVQQLSLYVNHQWALPKGWQIDYGITYHTSANDNDYKQYLTINNHTPDSVSHTQQKEWNGALYAGFNKSFSKLLTLQASISANYFRAIIDQPHKEKQALWKSFKPFINANISYSISDKHQLQYAFTTNIKYPAYWALNVDEVQMSPYSSIKGNPELKFSESYTSQLIYLFKKKYLLIGSYKYEKDYFTQMPYQQENALKSSFQVVNLDYAKTASVSLILPFNIGSTLHTRTTLSYIYTRQKDSDFLATPYKRSKHSAVANFNGSIQLSSRPHISFNLSAFYMSGATQGVYDIHQMHHINIGFKWTFLKSKAELSAKVNDLFNKGSAHTSIHIGNQWSRMTQYGDNPTFGLTFLYRFGGYTRKNQKEIDKSRLGRGY